jgi:type I restriction enzyme S subunit
MYGATAGQLGLLGRPMTCNQACCALIVDEGKANKRYLYYALRDKRTHLKSLANGAAQQNLNAGMIASLVLSVPPLRVQDAIGEVLGALDDKIEANARLVRLADDLWLATMKRAIDSWDPNEGQLPSGWAREPLSSFARFVNGRNFTKGATGSGRMVVRIAELNSGPGGSTVYNDVAVPSDHRAGPGDLLFAWSGSLTVRRWYRPEAIVNQHIFKVIPREDVPMWLVHGYLLKLLPWYRQVAADKATTMGHIQRHHLDEPVVLPDATTLQDLDAQCATLWRRALAAEQESLLLAELRDTLLPPLLSGELQVRDAEELVGETV